MNQIETETSLSSTSPSNGNSSSDSLYEKLASKAKTERTKDKRARQKNEWRARLENAADVADGLILKMNEAAETAAATALKYQQALKAMDTKLAQMAANLESAQKETTAARAEARKTYSELQQQYANALNTFSSKTTALQVGAEKVATAAEKTSRSMWKTLTANWILLAAMTLIILAGVFAIQSAAFYRPISDKIDSLTGIVQTNTQHPKRN
jgi:DNA repair exonuclease SbcCD ATPase subunit